jgi:repressor LexA
MESSVNSESHGTCSVPVLGKVAAGIPRFSESVNLGFISWNPETETSADHTIFALQVSGDSMIEDGIYDGHYIVVKYTADFNNGDIVIAYVNEEPTLKRIYRRGHLITLQPANPAFEPIVINTNHTPIRVGGRVIDVVKT